jgi:CheY-like chemotaxis protein
VELRTVIEAAVETVRPAAAARDIAIEVRAPRSSGTVPGDPGRLQQVMWNLLANAIKFTQSGGQVEVRLEQEGSTARVQVADTGNGIAPEFLPHVFERFRQADSSTTREHGGLGLGLAIVRHLVEAHGGTVSASSAGLGRGATFTVSLPIPAVKTRSRVEVDAEARAPQVGNGAPAVPPADLHGLRVLVVDDDEDTLEVLRELLEQAGAAVTAAGSAPAALRELEAHPPDVLLSDIGMPGEDGCSLIRKIRSLGAGRGGDVPAAALTAYTQAERQQAAMEAGFELYLAKPIDPGELTRAVARLASRAEAAAPVARQA